MASIGSLGVAAVALWRSFTRENASDSDERIKEVIQLTIGEDLALLNDRVKRIMKKLDINGDD